MTTITTICQFCHQFMHTKDGQGMSGTSHGICRSCSTLNEDAQHQVYRRTLEYEAYLGSQIDPRD